VETLSEDGFEARERSRTRVDSFEIPSYRKKSGIFRGMVVSVGADG